MKDYRILSVERISDGEIFSVGDELLVYEGCNYTRKIGEIEADENYEGELVINEYDETLPVTSIKSTSAITIIRKAK